MKKITSLVLVIIMTFSLFAFASCGNKRSPLDEYKQAFEKIKAMTAYDIEIVTEYAADYAGSVENTVMLEVYRTDGETAYYNRKYNGTAVTECWYTGGIYYSINEGDKEKNAISKEQYALNYAIGSSDVIFAIDDSAFEGKKFNKKDGVSYVSVDITPEEYAAFSGITINDNAVCTIGFDKEGEIVSFAVKAQYTASNGVVVDVNRTINFKKFSDVAPITAPVDAHTYRVAPAEDTADKTAVDISKVSVTTEKTDLVMIDVEGYGKILVRLYANIAPKTVANFQKLVSESYYDGVIFHRVIKDFMIQGGDGQNGDGTGGSSEKIKGEFTSNGFTNNLTHKRGVISMARTNDPDSASSQFFIVHKDSSHLDGQYASFGYVVSGMDVVDAIAAVETNSNDKPTTEVKMNSIKFVKVN